MPYDSAPVALNRRQQFHAWEELFDLLHEDRLGHSIDSRRGLAMAEALLPVWPSFGMTLTCIARRMRDLSADRA